MSNKIYCEKCRHRLLLFWSDVFDIPNEGKDDPHRTRWNACGAKSQVKVIDTPVKQIMTTRYRSCPIENAANDCKAFEPRRTLWEWLRYSWSRLAVCVHLATGPADWR